jgi:hypothetical protein
MLRLQIYCFHLQETKKHCSNDTNNAVGSYQTRTGSKICQHMIARKIERKSVRHLNQYKLSVILRSIQLLVIKLFVEISLKIFAAIKDNNIGWCNYSRCICIIWLSCTPILYCLCILFNVPSVGQK